MTLLRHELRQGRKSLCVWTAALSFFIVVCVFLYPEMQGEMGNMGDMFASMGAFSSAFGLDVLNFGTFLGYYAIEGGNVLGLGGALFASLLAVNALAKEEKDRTAEFLLTQPVGRPRIVWDKLLATALQIAALNLAAFALSAAAVAAIGEDPDWNAFVLLHLAYLLLQLELGGICFGISAFLRRSGLGVGLGIAITLYFLNIVANLTERAEFLKYITPFGYAEGAAIVSEGALDLKRVVPGLCVAALCAAAGGWYYCRKDIR